MATPDTSEYVAAEQAYELATQEESRTAAVLADAEAVITRLGPLPPSAVLKVTQIQSRAHSYADRDRAMVAHDAAVADLTAKTATRDEKWASLIAAS